MFTKPYSEDTAKIIDQEVSKLIESQYKRAIDILNKNKDKLKELANKLLTSEVIFKEDLKEIFGKRPWDKEENKEQDEKIVSTSKEESLKIDENKEENKELNSENESESDQAKTNSLNGFLFSLQIMKLQFTCLNQL